VSTHVDRAIDYARAVVGGEIPACKFVRLACQRQLDDLERFAGHPVYEWSPQHANHVCAFIERLPHVKGPKANAGELIHLEPWQCFVLTTVFGWRRKDTGGRRFRRAYIEVPRGNAKSTLSSGVALYALCLDGEQGAEVYSAATTRDQARITYGDAFDMLRKRPDFATRMKLHLPKTKMTSSPILHKETYGKFLPLSRESSNLDGLNPHFVVIDELHAHKTRDVYDVIETATAKRTASLLWCITTAGTDTAGICYEVRGFALKVLQGTVESDAAREAMFGIVYTIDDNDDWQDPVVWQKANPNWGVSVQPDSFEQLATKAMTQLSAQNNFKTKHLCLWMNAAEAWMDMRAWDRCANPNLEPQNFQDCPLYVGMDLATKTDIATKARIYVRWEHPPKCDRLTQGAHPEDCEESEPHYYLFCDHFLPENAIQDGRNSQYMGWKLEGWLKETQGEVLDFGEIKSSVVDDMENFQLRELAYDPWQSAQLAQELYAQGVQTVEIRATVQNFSAPMKELEAMVLAGRLHHNADPVLRWMVSNVVCYRDAKDNIYPRKEQPNNKIDGVVATIMALGRAMTETPPGASAGVRFM